jgi:hypothetical protein
MTLAGQPELLVKLPNRAAILPAFELAAHVVDLLQAQGRPGPGDDAQCFAGSPAGLLDLPLANMDGGKSGEETSAKLGGGVELGQAGLEGGLGVIEPAQAHVAQTLLAGQPRPVEEGDDRPNAIGVLGRLDGRLAVFKGVEAPLASPSMALAPASREASHALVVGVASRARKPPVSSLSTCNVAWGLCSRKAGRVVTLPSR